MPDRAIFLDRDDTLIYDPGYINHPDQVRVIEGVPEALIELRSMGYKLIIVSNQSAVARGIVTEKALADIHERLEHLLAEKDARIDKIYYCPYHVEGVIERYRKESDMRKPGPGMLLKAAEEMGLDLAQSWMIGDSATDIEAGRNAGCKTIMLKSPVHSKRPPSMANPDYHAVNMKEAVNIIKKHLRDSSRQAQREPTPAAPPQAPAPERLPTPVQAPAPSPEQAAEAPGAETTSEPSPAAAPSSRTDELLAGILEQLKGIHRTGMFAESEFSILRFMAGVSQILVPFCLLIAIRFLLSPERPLNPILISLGFAAVLQVMSLTLQIMAGRK